jgi:hypothetical protein
MLSCSAAAVQNPHSRDQPRIAVGRDELCVVDCELARYIGYQGRLSREVGQCGGHCR